jgi:hypothetical protein
MNHLLKHASTMLSHNEDYFTLLQNNEIQANTPSDFDKLPLEWPEASTSHN